jgi:tetratricopeptide (TPR) repeat protein
MMRKFFIFLLFLGVTAVVALNFKSIMALGQERIVSQQAGKAVEAKNWEKAIGLYQEAHREHPGNALIALRLAWLELMDQKPAEAEALYRQILKNDPDQLDAAMALGALLNADPKRVNQGILLLRHALKTHPHNPRLIAEIGNFYKTASENPQETREEKRKWLCDQAIYYYQAALKLDPRQFQTQFNLGVVNQSLDQLQPAAQAYCQAIMLNPKSYEARYNLGLVLNEQNFLEEAYRQMDSAVHVLGETGDIENAQALAVKVQTVKTRVFNSGQQGLSSKVDPAFLDKRCLVQPLEEAKTDQTN